MLLSARETARFMPYSSCESVLDISETVRLLGIQDCVAQEEWKTVGPHSLFIGSMLKIDLPDWCNLYRTRFVARKTTVFCRASCR